MQRWSIGQSRNMHGRQNTSAFRTSWSPTGRVARSSVGPKIATTGRPSAAARCMRAGVVRDEHDGRASATAVSAPRLVRPTRSTTRPAASGARSRSQDSIARAASRSCAAPTITHVTPRSRTRRAAIRPCARAATASPGRTPRQAQARRTARSGRCRAGSSASRASTLGDRVAAAAADRAIARDAEAGDESAIVVRLVPRRRAPRRRAPAREQQPRPDVGIAPSLGNAGAPELPGRAERVRKQDAQLEAAAVERGSSPRASRPASRPRDRADRRVLAEQRGDGRAAAMVSSADGNARDRGHRRQRQHRVAQPVRRPDDQTRRRPEGARRSSGLIRSRPSAAAGNMPAVSAVCAASSRQRRCIQSQRCGCRRTYISSTSVHRCVSSRTGSGDPAAAARPAARR